MTPSEILRVLQDPSAYGRHTIEAFEAMKHVLDMPSDQDRAIRAMLDNWQHMDMFDSARARLILKKLNCTVGFLV